MENQNGISAANEFAKAHAVNAATGEKAAAQEKNEPTGKSFVERMKEKREALNAKAESIYVPLWNQPDRYKESLEVMQRFSRGNGSLGGGAVNAVLIYSQNKEAHYLATFSQWQSHGYTIGKGEKAIKVFTPQESKSPSTEKKEERKSRTFYNVDSCFDICQVSGGDGSIEEVMKNGPQPQEVDDMLYALCSSNDYKMQFEEDMPDGYDAIYVPSTQTICLREGMSDEKTIFSILTELGHRAQVGKEEYDRSPETEFIAYSAAYILNDRYKILPGEEIPFPQDIFPGSVNSPGEIKTMLTTVYRTSITVGKEIEKGLERLAERNQEGLGMEDQEGAEL